MTVTCDTVRRAFGEFQCCQRCHENWIWPSDFPYQVCCKAEDKLWQNGLHSEDKTPTHPALLRAIEEQA